MSPPLRELLCMLSCPKFEMKHLPELAKTAPDRRQIPELKSLRQSSGRPTSGLSHQTCAFYNRIADSEASLLFGYAIMILFPRNLSLSFQSVSRTAAGRLRKQAAPGAPVWETQVERGIRTDLRLS